MYFRLNYCEENRIERIPISVKKIGNLFRPASEIFKADGFICSCFQTALELMIMNT